MPRVVERGTLRLRDIPGSQSADYGINGPDDARILCTPGGKHVYFWVSRGAHTKGQIGVGQNAPWKRSKKDKRYVDSVEAAVALAKMLGWLSDSGPLPETMK